jgi:hypothetical protein
VDQGREFSAPQGADDWLLFLMAEGASDAEPMKGQHPAWRAEDFQDSPGGFIASKEDNNSH